MKLRVIIAACAASLAAHSAGATGCSREIAMPVSANGASVIIDGTHVKGIYPDLLRSMAPKIGCQFTFVVVPRARQVAMFKSGTADLLAPASRTADRDQIGTFIPMINHRAMLISVKSSRAPIANAQELLARRELRVAVVRGFDYGEQYSALIEELQKQGRLFVEVDVIGVARLLNMGSADLTIMGPSLMAGAIRRDHRVQGLQEKLRTEAIPELPWRQSGAYLSNALKPEDFAILRDALEKAGKSNHVMEGYLHYFRPEVLTDSVRPRQ
ncbi:transporter substrate-binding domain-containing protein [Pseudoduganella sp. FT25W]|jgi:polar amino acid transport system substrate-binding protein|uniref:Transporter substrate-binding domain-containing protein n=1 Tax=Duganella alba TaxID=2666081 RepID=A0A6L5QLU9_9BURK|nr:transporter substrate-binding domain-containing protein [Duganella alba]MRX10242.1 transporter substrate-binding domain-containing protein [Duganella alba]MRX18529.1 transporter substrate-binding domain-containing protein [Duganella alba]